MTGRPLAALSFLASRCDRYPFFQAAGDSRWRVGVGLRRNVMAPYKLVYRNDRDADDKRFGFGFSRGGFTIRIARIHILWEIAHAVRFSSASCVCFVQILRCSAFVAFVAKKSQNQRGQKNFPSVCFCLTKPRASRIGHATIRGLSLYQSKFAYRTLSK
jgi:hypothetical protein